MKKGIKLERILIMPLLFLLIVCVGVLFFFVSTGNAVGNVSYDNTDNISSTSLLNNFNDKFVPGEIIVKFKSDPGFSGTEKSLSSNKKTLNELNSKYGIVKSKKLFDNIKQKSSSLNGDAISLDNIYKIDLVKGKEKDAVNEYSKDTNVEYAELNYIGVNAFVPNDPYYSDPNYGQAKLFNDYGLGVENAWDLERGSPNTIIAFIDAGFLFDSSQEVDFTQNLLGNCILGSGCPSGTGYDLTDINVQHYIDNGRSASSFPNTRDYVASDSDPSLYNLPVTSWGFEELHGNMVSNIASGKGNNAKSIAGICMNCKIMPIRAGFYVGAAGEGSIGLYESDDVANAIAYAADNHANIISMSFYTDFFVEGQPTHLIKDAVNYASSKGSILVAGAGNDNSNAQTYEPAVFDKVISVAAVYPNGALTSYSNYGSWVDIAAPGSAVVNFGPFEGAHLSGTSASAPYISGTIGLMKSIDPTLSDTQIRNILMQTDTLISGSKTIGGNNGRINIGAALQKTASNFCQQRLYYSSRQPEEGRFCCFNSQVVLSGQLAPGDQYNRFLCQNGQIFSHIHYADQPTNPDLFQNGGWAINVNKCSIKGNYYSYPNYPNAEWSGGWKAGNGDGVFCGAGNVCNGNGNCVTNLISNGDFSNGLTGWIKYNESGSIGIINPQYNMLAIQGYGYAYHGFATSPGKKYRLTLSSMGTYSNGYGIVPVVSIQNPWGNQIASLKVNSNSFKDFSLDFTIPNSYAYRVVLSTSPSDKDNLNYAFFDNVAIRQIS